MRGGVGDECMEEPCLGLRHVEEEMAAGGHSHRVVGDPSFGLRHA